MTVLETALLMLGGMNLYDALTHTFGTLATGGFSVKNSSVGHYNSAYIDGVITVFMVFAGINFTLYFKLVSGRISSVLKDTELKVYLAVFITAAALVSLNLYFQNGMNAGESIRYAAFQSASILTTTGYATADYAAWPAVSRTVIFILMFVGGCSGSTGGGIKVVRIIALFKQSINEMKYLVHPRGVFTIRINKSVVKKDILYGISAFVFLYFLLLMLATLVVASTGSGILTSFTTALACLGNIGPGFGQVGPAMNYAFYPDYVKWFLSFIMMIGRLEVDTVLILFTTVFWRR
jgi:trk system potassium uptake protein TrkH